jgi:hypothetical protein
METMSGGAAKNHVPSPLWSEATMPPLMASTAREERSIGRVRKKRKRRKKKKRRRMRRMRRMRMRRRRRMRKKKKKSRLAFQGGRA